jgi:hypothetical protein
MLIVIVFIAAIGVTVAAVQSLSAVQRLVRAVPSRNSDFGLV